MLFWVGEDICKAWKSFSLDKSLIELLKKVHFRVGYLNSTFLQMYITVYLALQIKSSLCGSK